MWQPPVVCRSAAQMASVRSKLVVAVALLLSPFPSLARMFPMLSPLAQLMDLPPTYYPPTVLHLVLPRVLLTLLLPRTCTPTVRLCRLWEFPDVTGEPRLTQSKELL